MFPFLIRFQPANTLLHMFIRLVTCCYALLNVVTSLEAKGLSNQFPDSHFIFVSNPRIPCYICSLGLLRVVTCFYIFRCETFVKLVSMFPFYIRFQPMNTFLHMFIGLVTCFYVLLLVVTSLEGKVCQSTFQVPITYSFQIHQYLDAYVPCAPYVLLRVVTRCYLLLHLQRRKGCQISFQVSILYSFTTD